MRYVLIFKFMDFLELYLIRVQSEVTEPIRSLMQALPGWVVDDKEKIETSPRGEPKAQCDDQAENSGSGVKPPPSRPKKKRKSKENPGPTPKRSNKRKKNNQ